MATTIDIRVAEGQNAIEKVRKEIQQANSALTQAQGVLTSGDKVLEEVEHGLELAGRGIKAGRRVAPFVIVAIGLAGVGAAVFVYTRKRAHAAAEQMTFDDVPTEQ